MPCSFCGNEKVIAKGLCRNCYHRQKRNGTLEYLPRRKAPLHCKFDDCDRPVIARGYCEAHYRHDLRHGDPVSSFGYGERRQHPLYEAWRWQVRGRGGRIPEWNDFWKFVEFAGEKPSEQHAARRHNDADPWGPDNFYWFEREHARTGAAEYQRVWRARNPLRSKGLDLKRMFGIGIDDYMRMYESQSGKCAICGRDGEVLSSKRGSAATLVVDHCHKSGNVRELLCNWCNTGIGSLQDSIDILAKASAYLRKHSP